MGRRAGGATTALVLALVLILRATPYLATGTVFSTDSWGLLRNTLVFERESPVSLSSDSFDGYNNYWPAPSISLAILRPVTALPIELGYLCISLSSVLAFILVMVMLGQTSVSPWNLLLPGLLFNVVMMTSAFTKEGYAYPLFAGALLLIMARGTRLKWLALCLFLSSLTLCHHLTSLALGLILGGCLARWLFGEIFYHRRAQVSVGAVALSLILLSTFVGIHYLALGKETFISNYVSYWYAVATASWIVLLSLIPFEEVACRRWRCLLPLFVTMSLALYLFCYSVKSVGLELDLGMAIAAASVLLLVPNVIELLRENKVPVDGWLTGLLALVLALVLEGIGIYYWVVYRILTFTLIAFTIGSRVDRPLLKLFICFYSILSITLLALTLAGLSVELGWHWLYRPSEIALARFLSNHAPTSLNLISDTKYTSMLRGFFGIHGTSSLVLEKGYAVLDEYMFTRGWLAGAGVVSVLEGGIGERLKNSAGVLYSSDGVFRKWLVWLS